MLGRGAGVDKRRQELVAEVLDGDGNPVKKGTAKILQEALIGVSVRGGRAGRRSNGSLNNFTADERQDNCRWADRSYRSGGYIRYDIGEGDGIFQKKQ